jgi:hypothetical protein
VDTRVAARKVPPWRGWGPPIILPAAVLLFTPNSWPRWQFMWLLVIGIYAGFKWLTWRRTPAPGARWWYHAGYLAGWPGLDAAAFLQPTPSDQPRQPKLGEWLFALSKFLLGVALFLGACLLPEDREILKGWLGTAGVVFVLHFGIFHLLSCFWRRVGRPARPLMDWPLFSTTVSEFWGRRWNRAFRDLSHRFLFRPLQPRLGAGWALVVVFVFSGLIHDLVISVPAQGGYGRPTLFFTLQAFAFRLERSRVGRRLGLGEGWRGWLFTATVLVAPAGLLFHPPFIRNVMVPFVTALEMPL